MYRVVLTEAWFDPTAELGKFTEDTHGDGAIVSFTGLARGTSRRGDPVDTLLLESYRGVTLSSMQQIANDAAARFSISRTLVIHRVGEIKPHEAIVFVATASPHRRAAFEAADYMMDRLKTEAVFWKKEIGPNGAQWIEPTEDDTAERKRWD